MPTPKDDVVEECANTLMEAINSEWASFNRDHMRIAARAVFAKLESLGLVVVPREPTKKMLEVGAHYLDRIGYAGEESAAGIYRAMIDSVSGD